MYYVRLLASIILQSFINIINRNSSLKYHTSYLAQLNVVFDIMIRLSLSKYTYLGFHFVHRLLSSGIADITIFASDV